MSEREHPQKGELWMDNHGAVRVMADPIEGYILARRSGAIPFVTSAADWHGRFKRYVCEIYREDA